MGRTFVRLRSLECPKEADLEPMLARGVHERASDRVDVVMPPRERAKASAKAGKRLALVGDDP